MSGLQFEGFGNNEPDTGLAIFHPKHEPMAPPVQPANLDNEETAAGQPFAANPTTGVPQPAAGGASTTGVPRPAKTPTTGVKAPPRFLGPPAPAPGTAPGLGTTPKLGLGK